MTKRFLVGLCVIALCSRAYAADTPPTDQQLRSADWWLDRALKFADRIPPGEDRDEAHYKLTYSLANQGEFGRAMIAAEEVTEPQIRIYSFSRIAKLAHQAGDESTCTDALAIASKAAIPAEIGQTNAHMVRLFFELGRVSAAFPFADALPHSTQRLHAISDIAAEHAKLGDVDQAMQIVRQHLPPNWLDSRRVVIVHGLATGKHFDKALALAEQIEKQSSRDNAFDFVADKLARADKVDQAKAVATRIVDSRTRDARLAQIAKATVKAGDGSIAASYAKATTREEKTSLGMLLIAEHIKAQNAEAAEALIESLAKIVQDAPAEAQVSKFGTFDDAQVIALIKAHYLDVALLLRNAGKEAAAKERIERAVAAVEAVESKGLGKMMIHNKLAQGLSALGETELARSLLAHQDTAYTKATSAGNIAASLILQGKVAEGLKLAHESVADHSMGTGTRRVAIALLTVKRYDELADYMSKMPDSKHEVRAFREIAQEMVKTDHVDRLNALIDELPSDAARTQACLGAHDMLRPKD